MESLPAKSPVAPRSRRRWFSFSLRVLFVVIAVVAIFPGRALYKAERQRQAVAHVLSLGGKVTYEHQMVKDKGYVPDAPAPGPSWLVDFFGVDFVARVHGVDIGTWSTKDVIRNSDLGRLEELSQAKSVGIRYSKWITDDGLRPISRFRDLEELVLDDLKGTSDQCLVHVSRLTKLKRFEAMRMPWTGAGCTYLSDLPLEELNLYQSSVTDECLRHIGRLRTLKRLYLGETKITDAGLAYVGQLKNLEELNICKTQISDEGIKHLLGLKKIREIQAFPTNITAASAAPLAEALPCCYITTPFGAYHAQDGGWAWQMFHEPAKASKE